MVGREEITLATTVEIPLAPGLNAPPGFVIPPNEPQGTKVPVFNVEPKPGEPARFGFLAGGDEEVFLETEVAWESDYHESFTIKSPPPGPPAQTLISRLVNIGTSGDGTYITNPTTCFDPEAPETNQLYSTWFRAESFGEPDEDFPNGSTPVEAKLPEGGKPEECDTIPFEPDIDVEPGTNQVDSPASPTVTTTMPFEVPTAGGDDQGQSHLRSATVQMPAGMGLNPSGSVGLAACTDAQFNKGVRINDNTCPANSVIGSAEVIAPVLRTAHWSGLRRRAEELRPHLGRRVPDPRRSEVGPLGIVTRLVGNVDRQPDHGPADRGVR